MEINEHLKIAIRMHEDVEINFHDLMSWHLLHGVVIATADFLCLGYFCKKDALETPLPEDQADTGLIAYMGGNMKKLINLELFPWRPGIKHIAFSRIKNDKPLTIYSMDRLKKLINTRS